MKTAIVSCVLAFLIIITSLILLTIYEQNTRQNELEDSLSVAIEQSLENLKTKQNYSIANTDEFVADFIQNLIVSIESDSDIKVEILNVDFEKGLLDVNVVETFIQPNGSKNNVSCRKTVILEEYSGTSAQYFMVEFLTPHAENSGEFVEFKTYSISSGSLIIIPSIPPAKEGFTFIGWSQTKPDESNDYSPETISIDDVDGKLAVTENLVFYAVFKQNES